MSSRRSTAKPRDHGERPHHVRYVAHRGLRDGGAENAVRPAPRRRKSPGRVRVDRTRRGVGRRRHEHRGGGETRPLRLNARRSSSPMRAWRNLRRDRANRSRAQKTRGISAFIVTRTRPISRKRSGWAWVTIRRSQVSRRDAAKKEDKLGWRASDTRELCCRTRSSRRRTSSGPEQRLPTVLHTLDGVASAWERSPSALPKARWRNASVIPRLANNSASPSPASRASTSRSRHGDGNRGGHAPRVSLGVLKQHGRPFKKEAAMASCTPPSCHARHHQAVQLHGGTATRQTTQSSG